MDSFLSSERRAAIFAALSALLSWVLYYIRNNWHPSSSIIGVLFELFYIPAVYMLMPFAFSGLLLAAVSYAGNRLRGVYERDVLTALLLLMGLGLAFVVIGPVMGEGTAIIITGVLFVIRLVRSL